MRNPVINSIVINNPLYAGFKIVIFPMFFFFYFFCVLYDALNPYFIMNVGDTEKESLGINCYLCTTEIDSSSKFYKNTNKQSLFWQDSFNV